MSPSKPLEQIRIARPCPSRWEEMKGDERVRFCGLCQKNVYNLSAMSREAATRLLEEREGDLCARLYRRQDGTILTSDCPVGVKAFASRILRRAAAVTASLLMILGGRYFTLRFEEKHFASPPEDSSRPQLSGPHRQPTPEELKQLEELVGSLGYFN